MSETSGAGSTDGAVRADLAAATGAAGSADAAVGNQPAQGSSAQEGRNFRKTREGLVVSDKMHKTVVVAVEDRVQHPLYHKTMRRTNKLKAHDEQNAAGIGDRVLLMETRPLSASKRWRVVEILEKAK
jgi:small subunit ribosomal protein S17